MMFKMTQERINTLVIYEFYKWSNGHYNYLMYNTFFDKRLRSLFPEWFVDYVIEGQWPNHWPIVKTVNGQLRLWCYSDYKPIKAGDYIFLHADRIRLSINGVTR